MVFLGELQWKLRSHYLIGARLFFDVLEPCFSPRHTHLWLRRVLLPCRLTARYSLGDGKTENVWGEIASAFKTNTHTHAQDSALTPVCSVNKGSDLVTGDAINPLCPGHSVKICFPGLQQALSFQGWKRFPHKHTASLLTTFPSEATTLPLAPLLQAVSAGP